MIDKIARIVRQQINIIDRINSLMYWPMIILLTAITLVVILEIIMRYIFHKPTGFGIEICQAMQVACVMLGAGYILKEDGHVRVDFIFTNLNHKWRRYVGFTFSVLSVLYCGGLAWTGWLFVKNSFLVGEITYGLNLPFWLIKILFVVGICLFGLQFIVVSYNYLRKETL